MVEEKLLDSSLENAATHKPSIYDKGIALALSGQNTDQAVVTEAIHQLHDAEYPIRTGHHALDVGRAMTPCRKIELVRFAYELNAAIQLHLADRADPSAHLQRA